MFLTALMFVKGLFGGVVKFFSEHPMLLVMLSVSSLSLFIGFKIGYAWEEKRYDALVVQVKADSEARAKKIEQVETDSKKAAEEAKTEIAAKTAAITAITTNYEKKLSEARKNPKIQIVKVPVPGAKEPAEVIVENGTVECRNLPSVFTDTINDMVDIANGKVKQ
jgi:cytoskeletal protein RodZ